MPIVSHQYQISNKNTLTHLIIVSCTGMYASGLDIGITHTLQLPTHIKRSTIQFMGCYGAFNGLKIANDICQANHQAKVLMVSVELCTLHVQKSKNIHHGAAAVLIEGNPQQKNYLRLQNFYCDILPSSTQEMTWHIGDSGFEMMLTAYVPQGIKSGIAQFAEKCLSQQFLHINAIDFYTIHPGGMKILQACEQALGISKQDNRYAYHVLREYGNMSSATVLFVLKIIWDNLAIGDHQKTIFSCAFGPGLTLESMLLDVHFAQ